MDAIHPAPAPAASAFAIARAGWRDLRAARALERLCFGADAWGYFELGFTLIQPGLARFKALDGGRSERSGHGERDDRPVVGLVIGESRPFEGAGWVASICVHPAYQRRGIGGALLAACEAALPQRVIKLTVRESNRQAIALYRQFGYERVAVWQNYYASGEDGLVMEKSKRA